MSRKSIIITGGASGIGKALTNHLCTSPESHITILDVDTTSAQETRLSILSQHPNASISIQRCDVSSWESQALAFSRVYSAQGRIDVVFANAGITEKGTLLPVEGEEEPIKPDTRTAEVNFWGCLYSVKLAIFYIMKNKVDTERNIKGSIICTASSAGLYGFHVAPLYAASKHAIVGLVRSLWRYLDQEKIQINALAPGVIETNIAPDKALFKSMHITPMATAINAVDKLLGDTSLTGRVVELHGENFSFAEQKEFADEGTKNNIEMFWKLGYA
ncbi:short chain dehydrogenase reductase [Aspergillus sclerotialis]|uniref:Short chain dehydrogenase reductase n=1 Tax=Aspergillus sclerotialis TaxID=2070753 RepID=A0A3A3A8Q5_9EURO|nr:short chain dehydrogenase reductase [Aspergillus sclerotialis]